MTPILIFQSISSFNPDLREINFYEKYCQFIVWGPKLQALWRNRGSANRPKMDQFENFSIIYCTKSKLKGEQFNEKNANSCILGPILWAVLDILGGSANRPTIDRFEKFWTFFYTKSKFKGGLFYEKNRQLMYLRPHFAGRFLKWGVCRSAQNGPIKKIFNFFSHKIRIKRGSV